MLAEAFGGSLVVFETISDVVERLITYRKGIFKRRRDSPHMTRASIEEASPGRYIDRR